VTRRRQLLVGVAAAALAIVGVVLVARGGSDDSKNSTTSAAPTRAQLEAVTGLRFPSSISKYETVQLHPGQIDVRFELPASEVNRLVSGSGLPPLAATRVIQHPSPLWALNPSGPIRGTTVTRRGAQIDLEVVGGDPAVVRLSVLAVPTTTTTTSTTTTPSTTTTATVQQ
jgi:hypothetical protein